MQSDDWSWSLANDVFSIHPPGLCHRGRQATKCPPIASSPPFADSQSVIYYLLLFSIPKPRRCTSLSTSSDFLLVSTMVKIMKSQKVVIVLAGRFAGRKAVVIKVWMTMALFFLHFRFVSFRASRTMKGAMNEVTVTLLSLASLAIHERSRNEWERRNKLAEIKSNRSSKWSTTIIWWPPGKIPLTGRVPSDLLHPSSLL